MRFLAYFMRAWRTACEAIAYDSFADSAEGWTQQDASNLRAFFGSPSGGRFGKRLANYRVRCACDATKEHANASYHAGLAQGVALTISTIENHFARPLRSEDKSEENQPTTAADSFAINQ